MTADLTPTNASPFDAVRQVRADSSEFWTARDLMPLLGYDKWQNFERVIAEARHAAEIVGAADQFTDSGKKYSVGAVAKMLGSSQNKLFRDLRNCGVFIAKGSMRNTPYQQYMRHFEVRAHEYERSNGEPGCSYTTYVQPSGIDFIRCKLSLPTIDPLPVEVGTAEANA